jgi:hypothetical protein
MKNLNLFLWIFTTAMAILFAYHTYTHTRIRYKDLESVMMQNLAVEKGIEVTRQNTERQLLGSIDLAYKQGNTSKDRAILKKAKLLRNYADTNLVILDSLSFIAENTKIDGKISLKAENIALLNEYHQKIPLFFAAQDTSLTDLGEAIPFLWDNQKHCPAFIQKNNVGIKSRFVRIETKSIDRLTSQIGGVYMCCFCRSIYCMASAKSQIIKTGENYEASMFLTTDRIQIRPQIEVSEGKINIRGDIVDIEIKNVKAQNYNSEGKATKTLTGKITIKKADGSDTTFTLSTSYTVKKKL